MAMRRADRGNNSNDNALNHPTSRQSEPISYHELKQFLASARASRIEAEAKRDELQKVVEAKQQQVEQTDHLYQEEQQKHQTALTLYQKEQQKYATTLTLYQEEQQKHQTALTLYQEEHQKYSTALTQYQEEQQKYTRTLTLYQAEQQKYTTALTQVQEAQTQSRSYLLQYEEAQTQAKSYFTQYQEAESQAQSYLGLYQAEKVRGDELVIKVEAVQGERDRYLTLYNESQDQLKFERRSKAGIKGWETRRKKENQRLKQEISEMTVLLRDSFERKDAAVSNLYVLAERMDRIQQLVDSVDETSTTSPMGMIQKFQRIWQTVKDILAE
ncbi:hypothetical protein ACKFKF_06735 [Phormidesmis sp. 146-12]